MKKYYVAGFMFSPDLENVVLIEKEKPEWQKGRYNAIGGKIEKGETPLQAMVREFEEEAFIQTKQSDWKNLCLIGDDKYEVYFFYCTFDRWRDYLTREDEEIFHVLIMDLHSISHKLIDNLNWLIPLCIDKAKNYSGNIRTTEIYSKMVTF